MHLLSLFGDRVEVLDEEAICAVWDISGGLAVVDMCKPTNKTKNDNIKHNDVHALYTFCK